MGKIGFKQDGVGHFIADNFLKVPFYQRSFAWEESHVQDLFEDIQWTPQVIKERQKEFAEGAIKIWGIDIS